jgi:predicted RNase H-like nuclease (RuvC/YqgF family)
MDTAGNHEYNCVLNPNPTKCNPVPTIGDKINEINFLHDTIDTLRNELYRLDLLLSEKNITISTLEQQAHDRRNHLAEAKAEIERLYGDFAMLYNQHRHKDKEISDLRNQLAEKDSEIDKLADEVLFWQEEMNPLHLIWMIPVSFLLRFFVNGSYCPACKKLFFAKINLPESEKKE